MKIKLILAVLCLSLVSLLNISVVMAEENTSGDFVYQVLPDGTISIIEYIGYDVNVVIPETIDGYEVSTIARIFNNKDRVKKVVIYDGVKKIGERAFSSCSTLERVYLPDSLVEIGDEAFSRCENLEQISIPANVETIGARVFYLCDNLVSIDVDSNNTKFFSYNGVLYSKESEEDITLLIYPQGLDGGNEYFVYDGTTAIAENAFIGCKEVVSVVVPSTVKSIGTGAFLSCTSLRSIYLPDSLKMIGEDAFYNCTSLKKIYYESGIGAWNIIFQYHDELPETEILCNYIRRENPFGDVNGDNYVNAVDALMVLQYAAKIEDLGEQSLLSAEVTGDAVVNAEDAYYILASASKIIDKFPGDY